MNFNAAVEASELALAKLNSKRDCPRTIVRAVRALRRCDRLRTELAILLETGSL